MARDRGHSPGSGHGGRCLHARAVAGHWPGKIQPQHRRSTQRPHRPQRVDRRIEQRHHSRAVQIAPVLAPNRPRPQRPATRISGRIGIDQSASTRRQWRSARAVSGDFPGRNGLAAASLAGGRTLVCSRQTGSGGEPPSCGALPQLRCRGHIQNRQQGADGCWLDGWPQQRLRFGSLDGFG